MVLNCLVVGYLIIEKSWIRTNVSYKLTDLQSAAIVHSAIFSSRGIILYLTSIY